MKKCKWWHWFFETFLEENQESIKGNWAGAETRAVKHERKYFCHICKKVTVIDLLKDVNKNGEVYE